MKPGDLSRPIQNGSAALRVKSALGTPLAFASAALAGGLVALVLWLSIAEAPLGGEPVAKLELQPARNAADIASDGAGLGMRNQLNPEDNVDYVPTEPKTTAATDGRQDPLDEQFDQLMASGGQIIDSLPTAPLAGLSEQGANGSLPKISSAGKTPAQAYARPISRAQADPNTAKIAILVGGMGLSVSGTSIAINRLPADVSLAFAPYSKSLQKWVHKARQNGHEVMMQLPMEPFDYPDNDPGPHTLLSTLPPPDNVRRLEWLLSRFTGYFGVTNYMGAKFTSSTDALRPVFRQLNRRGLVYMEDGSSARSHSQKIARDVKLKATSADLIIDSDPNVDAIKRALKQLETIALERGIAIGVASGLPVTVEQITEWTATLKEKGIQLVPVSATITLRHNMS
ncbi:MAG: divergent polysaccharide deacetylase family protein [Hyphomicrobiales bacterium]